MLGGADQEEQNIETQERLYDLIDWLDPRLIQSPQIHNEFEEQALALLKQHPELLLAHCSYYDNMTPLIAAVRNQAHPCSIPVFKKLLKMIIKTDPNALNDLDSFGRSALHYMAVNDHFEHIKLFLETKRALVDLRDTEGCTPAYFAALKGNHRALLLLTVLGNANVNIANNQAQTPLHAACIFGQEVGGKREEAIDPDLALRYEECIYALLRSKADPNAQDIQEDYTQGLTPPEILTQADIPDEVHDRLLDKLRDYGAKHLRFRQTAMTHGLHLKSRAIVPSLKQLAANVVANSPPKQGESLHEEGDIAELIQNMKISSSKPPDNPSK